MDTSFDLVALLRRQQPTTKSHKIRPTQFVSVAGGVLKRLETNIKNRKSSRLSVFDRLRNIAKCETPKAPAVSDTLQKGLQRRQQLEKWKEEKDKNKKLAAARKKKPFVAGMSQRQTFGPPPPPPIPRTSGRVTRSQARLRVETNTQTKSFAPRNATFKPSIFLDTEVPKLAPLNKKEGCTSKSNITFEPVLPKNVQKETRPATRNTRANPIANKPVVESKTRKPNDKNKVNTKTTNNILRKPPLLKQQMFQSSSSSETEEPKLRKKPSLCKCTAQDSACVLHDASTSSPDTVSMTSHEHNSQDTASMSSEDCFDSQHNTFDSQDNATVIQVPGSVSMSSHDKLSTPRIKVPRSESSSEEKLRSPQPIGGLTPELIVEEAIKNVSPFVTVSRGKDNARKEMKKKRDEGLLDEDASNMDSVNHFRRQLHSEIARLTATCHTWDQIFAQTEMPEPVQELVLTAVGQARLLMSQKLQQFAGLVERCAKPAPGTALVTPADLHGFWDMVFMQVENVEMRFKNLEELRLRDWIEEQQPLPKKVVAKPAAKKTTVKPSGGPSRLKEMIAAARKARKNQESQLENSESDKSEPTASPETKTFEAGFFRVSSPLKRSPAPGTPGNKSSLLKSVLSSEAKKSVSKNSTSFAMLRASLMSKNVDIEGVSPLMQTPTITPVNLYATPARSILKQNNPISTKKTVLFQQTDEPSSPTSFTSCEVDSELAPLPADDKENEDTPGNKGATPRRRGSRRPVRTATSPAPHCLAAPRLECARSMSCLSAPAPAPAPSATPAMSAQAARYERRSASRSPLRPLTDNTHDYNFIRLARQNTVDHSVTPPSPFTTTTRSRRSSRRESAQTPLVEADTNVPKKRSTRKAKESETPLVEADASVVMKRSTRKSKQVQPAQESETPLVEADASVLTKRSTRKTKQVQPAQETETPLVKADASVLTKRSTRKTTQVQPAQETETPKRSSRRRKSAAAV